MPVHSGYFPIVPGSESLFMSSSCHSLFNVIKYALGRYYKYKILDSHQKILQKSMKKNFFWSLRVWTGDLEVMRPACYQKATEICWYNDGFLMDLKTTASKWLFF